MAIGIAGCRSSVSDGTETLRGFVRLQALEKLHPGWTDVRYLDALIARAALPVSPPAQTPFPVSQTRVAEPLPPQSAVARAGPESEAVKIDAIRNAAYTRIRSLQTTLNQRTARIIERKQKLIENQADVDIRNAVEKLREESIRRKADRRLATHDQIRDLGFQEIALASQVNSLSKYPGGGGPARVELQKKLAGVRTDKKALEDSLAADLVAIDARLKQDIIASEAALRREALAKVRQVKEAEEQRQAETTRRYANEVDIILATLAPLDTSDIPAPKRVVSLPLVSPYALASNFQRANSPDGSAASRKEASILAAQRDKMVQFITDDVKRRLSRLEAQKQLEVHYAPGGGLGDITDQVADLLRAEWKP